MTQYQNRNSTQEYKTICNSHSRLVDAQMQPTIELGTTTMPNPMAALSLRIYLQSAGSTSTLRKIPISNNGVTTMELRVRFQEQFYYQSTLSRAVTI